MIEICQQQGNIWDIGEAYHLKNKEAKNYFSECRHIFPKKSTICNG